MPRLATSTWSASSFPWLAPRTTRLTIFLWGVLCRVSWLSSSWLSSSWLSRCRCGVLWCVVVCCGVLLCGVVWCCVWCCVLLLCCCVVLLCCFVVCCSGCSGCSGCFGCIICRFVGLLWCGVVWCGVVWFAVVCGVCERCVGCGWLWLVVVGCGWLICQLFECAVVKGNATACVLRHCCDLVKYKDETVSSMLCVCHTRNVVPMWTEVQLIKAVCTTSKHTRKIHRDHFFMGDHSKGMAFASNRAQVVRSYTCVTTTQEPRSIGCRSFRRAFQSLRTLRRASGPDTHFIPRIALTRFPSASRTPPSPCPEPEIVCSAAL